MANERQSQNDVQVRLSMKCASSFFRRNVRKDAADVASSGRLFQILRPAVANERQPSPTCRTAFPAQHLRPSGVVLSCWPDGLELTPGFYPRYPTSSTDCFRRLLVGALLVHPVH